MTKMKLLRTIQCGRKVTRLLFKTNILFVQTVSKICNCCLITQGAILLNKMFNLPVCFYMIESRSLLCKVACFFIPPPATNHHRMRTYACNIGSTTCNKHLQLGDTFALHNLFIFPGITDDVYYYA